MLTNVGVVEEQAGWNPSTLLEIPFVECLFLRRFSDRPCSSDNNLQTGQIFRKQEARVLELIHFQSSIFQSTEFV